MADLPTFGGPPACSRRPRQRYRPPAVERFDVIDARSAYWLGFLFADGCVSRRELIVVLQRRDADHLRSLLEYLGTPDRPLAPANGGTAVRLAIGSAALARKLTAYGVVAGRAGSAQRVSDALAANRHFWRGIVDGDGSIRHERRSGLPSLVVVGAPGLMHQLADFLAGVCGDGVRPKPYRHSQSARVLLVSVGGRRAASAIRALYSNAPDALPRKRERARRAMAWRPQVVHRYPWDSWGDGSVWRLRRGRDFDTRHRLWEAGRREARHRGCRLELSPMQGDVVELRFVRRD